jgi:hypothetical protein
MTRPHPFFGPRPDYVPPGWKHREDRPWPSPRRMVAWMLVVLVAAALSPVGFYFGGKYGLRAWAAMPGRGAQS